MFVLYFHLVKDIKFIPVYNITVNYDEMACVNNQYFEFQEMQLN